VSELTPFELGYARTDLRRRLVDAVLRGEKTATAGLRTDYVPHTDEPLPQAGERFALLDFDDRPVAVVETTEVKIVRPATSSPSSRATKARASRASRTGVARTRGSGPSTTSTTTR
jgi:hypothetical protein